MALTAREVVERVHEILSETETDRQIMLKTRLVNLIISALSPHQNLVYGYMGSHEWVTSTEIAQRFGWEVTYASNLLTSLTELKLTERQPVTDRLAATGRFGLHYQWKRISFS